MCSTRRKKEIAAAVKDFRVPLGVPVMKCLLSSTVGMKIVDAMAWCGPRGAYMIGLTDIDDDLKELFITLLGDVCWKIIDKTPDVSKLSTYQQNLVLYVSSEFPIFCMKF